MDDAKTFDNIDRSNNFLSSDSGSAGLGIGHFDPMDLAQTIDDGAPLINATHTGESYTEFESFINYEPYEFENNNSVPQQDSQSKERDGMDPSVLNIVSSSNPNKAPDAGTSNKPTENRVVEVALAMVPPANSMQSGSINTGLTHTPTPQYPSTTSTPACSPHHLPTHSAHPSIEIITRTPAIPSPRPYTPAPNLYATAPRRRSHSMPPGQPSSPSFQRRLEGRWNYLAPIGTPIVRNIALGPPLPVPRSHPYDHAKLNRYATDPSNPNLLLRRQMAYTPSTPTEEDMRLLDMRFDSDHFHMPSPMCTPRVQTAQKGRKKAIRSKRARETGDKDVSWVDARRKQMERILTATMAMETVRRDALVMEVDGELKEYRDRIRAQNYAVYAMDQALLLIEPVRRCEFDLPGTGAMMKHLTVLGIDAALRTYDLPVLPNMFLHEKKLLLLQFLGLNEALMHEILD